MWERNLISLQSPGVTFPRWKEHSDTEEKRRAAFSTEVTGPCRTRAQIITSHLLNASRAVKNNDKINGPMDRKQHLAKHLF